MYPQFWVLKARGEMLCATKIYHQYMWAGQQPTISRSVRWNRPGVFQRKRGCSKYCFRKFTLGISGRLGEWHYLRLGFDWSNVTDGDNCVPANDHSDLIKPRIVQKLTGRALTGRTGRDNLCRHIVLRI